MRFFAPANSQEMAQILKTKGFVITYSGDDTVGMFQQEWQLSGDFNFNDQSDLDVFKRKISEAFEFCSDTPILVESLEERSTRINGELAAFPGAFHSA